MAAGEQQRPDRQGTGRRQPLVGVLREPGPGRREAVVPAPVLPAFAALALSFGTRIAITVAAREDWRTVPLMAAGEQQRPDRQGTGRRQPLVGVLREPGPGRRDAYRATGGHGAIRAGLHDGVQLPRVFRRAGLRTDLVAPQAVPSDGSYGRRRISGTGR
jgi:hypothetical protein